jgi:hypothetical protein
MEPHPYRARQMNPEEPKRYVILLFRPTLDYIDVYVFLKQKKREVMVDSQYTRSFQQRMMQYPDDVILTFGYDDIMKETITVRNARENKVEQILLSDFYKNLDIYDDF